MRFALRYSAEGRSRDRLRGNPLSLGFLAPWRLNHRNRTAGLSERSVILLICVICGKYCASAATADVAVLRRTFAEVSHAGANLPRIAGRMRGRTILRGNRRKIISPPRHEGHEEEKKEISICYARSSRPGLP